MQADYPRNFDREHGCAEADWLRWLPGAVGVHRLLSGMPAGRARVEIGAGALDLTWQVLPPRQIALARLPRLAVSYRFDGVDEAARKSFMRYFDLYLQRGGG